MSPTLSTHAPTHTVPVGRAARSAIPRNLAGCLAVLVALVLIGLGPLALNRAIPSLQPVDSTRPMAFGAEPVTVIPPPGARLDTAQTDPDNQFMLMIADVQYVLRVYEYDESLLTLDVSARDDVRAWGFQDVSNDRPMITRQGIHGIEASCAAPGRAGSYTVLVAHGVAVVVETSGAPRTVATSAAAIEASIATITIGSPR
jgi:hypothetical protein